MVARDPPGRVRAFLITEPSGTCGRYAGVEAALLFVGCRAGRSAGGSHTTGRPTHAGRAAGHLYDCAVHVLVGTRMSFRILRTVLNFQTTTVPAINGLVPSSAARSVGLRRTTLDYSTRG
jgi:hypothetical protein